MMTVRKCSQNVNDLDLFKYYMTWLFHCYTCSILLSSGVLCALRLCLLEVSSVSISQAELAPTWCSLLLQLLGLLQEITSFILGMLNKTLQEKPTGELSKCMILLFWICDFLLSYFFFIFLCAHNHEDCHY